MKRLLFKTFIFFSSLCIIFSLNSQNSSEKTSFVHAASVSTPCVVHIKTKATVQQNFYNPFADFFGNDFFFRPQGVQKHE